MKTVQIDLNGAIFEVDYNPVDMPGTFTVEILDVRSLSRRPKVKVTDQNWPVFVDALEKAHRDKERERLIWRLEND